MANVKRAARHTLVTLRVARSSRSPYLPPAPPILSPAPAPAPPRSAGGT
jgi:hypothetical protein